MDEVALGVTAREVDLMPEVSTSEITPKEPETASTSFTKNGETLALRETTNLDTSSHQQIFSTLLNQTIGAKPNTIADAKKKPTEQPQVYKEAMFA